MRHIRSLIVASLAVVTASFASSGSAAVISSGPLTTVIPSDPIGLYQNVITGTTYSGPATFPPAGPGFNWDFNIYGTTTYTFFWSGSTTSGHDTAQPSTNYGYVAAAAGATASALAPGATISVSSIFSTASSATNLTTGAPVYFGFRFTNEGATTSAADDTVHYGYAQVRLTNGAPGTLLSYAYESTPGAAITIAVPEPVSAATVVGIGGLLLRRRRTA